MVDITDEKDVNYSEISNRDEILNRLNLCLSTGGASLGGYVSVGITNQDAINTLTKAISDGITNRKNTNLEKETNEETKNIGNYLIESNKRLDDISKKRSQEIQNQEEKNKKIFGNISSWVSDNFPNITKIAQATYKSIEFLYNQQIGWINRYNQLNSSGVYLEGGLDSLKEKADRFGVTIDDMVGIYTNHSEVVAKMGGLFNNGTESFSKLLGGVSDLGKALGMSKKEVADISSSFVSNFGYIYSSEENNIEILKEKTSQYMIYLDKLSKATGKSREAILKETEARENETRWKLWLSDPVNRMKYMAWNQAGLSKEVMEAKAFGLPNGQSVMFDYSAPELSEKLNFNGITTEEGIQEAFGEIIKEIKEENNKKEILNEREEYLNNGLYRLPEEWQKLTQQGLMSRIKILELDENGWFKNDEKFNKDAEWIKEAFGVVEEKNKLINDITQSLKLDADNLKSLTSNVKSIVGTVRTMVDKLLPAVNSFINFSASHPIITGIGLALGDALYITLGKFFGQKFGNFLGSFFGRMGGFFGSKFSNFINPYMEKWGPKFSGMGDKIKSSIGGLSTKIKGWLTPELMKSIKILGATAGIAYLIYEAFMWWCNEQVKKSEEDRKKSTYAFRLINDDEGFRYWTSQNKERAERYREAHKNKDTETITKLHEEYKEALQNDNLLVAKIMNYKEYVNTKDKEVSKARERYLKRDKELNEGKFDLSSEEYKHLNISKNALLEQSKSTMEKANKELASITNGNFNSEGFMSDENAQTTMVEYSSKSLEEINSSVLNIEKRDYSPILQNLIKHIDDKKIDVEQINQIDYSPILQNLIKHIDDKKIDMSNIILPNNEQIKNKEENANENNLSIISDNLFKEFSNEQKELLSQNMEYLKSIAQNNSDIKSIQQNIFDKLSENKNITEINDNNSSNTNNSVEGLNKQINDLIQVLVDIKVINKKQLEEQQRRNSNEELESIL